MQIAEICTRAVVTCGRQASIAEVAQLMRDAHVGDVVVVDERDGRKEPVGIVTDRDLVVQVLAKQVDPGALCAGDLIRTELVSASESEAVYDAIWHMRSKGIRRLPVVDSHNGLKGILTADDVARYLAQQLSDVASIVPQQLLHEQKLVAPADAAHRVAPGGIE